MRYLFLISLLVTAACASGPSSGSLAERRANAAAATALPPMKRFSTMPVSPPLHSNTDIARDFLDLSFQMESGRPIPYMTRFEGPITLRVTGDIPPSLGPDLQALLLRLRNEAGIRIRRVSAETPASITIQALPRATMQKFVPQAACFVVPQVSSWGEYRRNRRSRLISWTALKKREKVAIFLPGDVSPQEVRDCLHEELAQAIGPLNDLYRLPDSVFNDDNFHTILTGFDMLILRTYYAPELHNGMSRSAVAAVLPRVLARLNPRGRNKPAGPFPAPTSRAWINAIEDALGPKGNSAQRRAAANRAVTIAKNAGWNDTRLAFSLFALGRLSLSTRSETAFNAFLASGHIYSTHRETRVQAAHVAMQLSAFALSAGDGEAALELINSHLPAVVESENAALLASMLMIKAEALELVGRASEAREVRLDSLGWARYGFGSDKEVRKRLAQISALSPRRIINAMRDQ